MKFVRNITVAIVLVIITLSSCIAQTAPPRLAYESERVSPTRLSYLTEEERVFATENPISKSLVSKLADGSLQLPRLNLLTIRIVAGGGYQDLDAKDKIILVAQDHVRSGWLVLNWTNGSQVFSKLLPLPNGIGPYKPIILPVDDAAEGTGTVQLSYIPVGKNLVGVSNEQAGTLNLEVNFPLSGRQPVSKFIEVEALSETTFVGEKGVQFVVKSKDAKITINGLRPCKISRLDELKDGGVLYFSPYNNTFFPYGDEIPFRLVDLVFTDANGNPLIQPIKWSKAQ